MDWVGSSIRERRQKERQMLRAFITIWIVCLFAASAAAGAEASPTTEAAKADAEKADRGKPAVTFAGGHDIARNDHGRPIPLIAAALGVPDAVFREAFSGVTPARNGKPSPEDARKNKAALLKVLAPHGVTNERLDEVSNYYRFRPQEKESWPTTLAKAHAVMEGGKVKEIVIDEGGAGYSTPPTVTIDGVKGVTFKVTLSFGKDLKTNGAVKSIEVVPAK